MVPLEPKDFHVVLVKHIITTGAAHIEQTRIILVAVHRVVLDHESVFKRLVTFTAEETLFVPVEKHPQKMEVK